MKDQTIGIKPLSKLAAGSLARRVFYGSLILLGLPLLVHTLFLYRREYQENVDDAFLTLHQVGESCALYLEGVIQNQQNLLGALGNDLPPSEKEAFLQQEAAEYHLGTLFFVDYEGGQFSCNSTFCKDSSFAPFLKEAIQSERFAFINPYVEKPSLYVGRTVPSSGMPKGLFLAATPTESLLEMMKRLSGDAYPLRLSLIDESGKIFLSTEKGLQGTRFAESSDLLSWTPEGHVSNAWFLKIDQKTFLAVKNPIVGIDYTLLLDVPEKALAQLEKKTYLFRIGSFLLFVLLIGGAGLAWFTKFISRPLRSLSHVMQRVSEGAMHVRFTPDWMGFEINVLGRQFNQMLDSLLMHQQEAERERIIRERLAQELKIGHEIQANMLGGALPEFSHIEIAPGYLPAREVSGDFYDLYALKDGRLLITIADAAGKGISACLFSLSFRSMLRTAATLKTDLAEIVKTANQMLLLDTALSSTFITAWIGIYDPASKELVYCSQGHPNAWLRRGSGELLELPSRGLALGVEEIDPAVEKVTLHSQDLLFLYTDGIIEAHDPSYHLFGVARLKEFLQRSKKTSGEMLVGQLLEEIHLFCSSAPQADDITLLALFIREKKTAP